MISYAVYAATAIGFHCAPLLQLLSVDYVRRFSFGHSLVCRVVNTCKKAAT